VWHRLGNVAWYVGGALALQALLSHAGLAQERVPAYWFLPTGTQNVPAGGSDPISFSVTAAMSDRADPIDIYEASWTDLQASAAYVGSIGSLSAAIGIHSSVDPGVGSVFFTADDYFASSDRFSLIAKSSNLRVPYGYVNVGLRYDGQLGVFENGDAADPFNLWGARMFMRYQGRKIDFDIPTPFGKLQLSGSPSLGYEIGRDAANADNYDVRFSFELYLQGRHDDHVFNFGNTWSATSVLLDADRASVFDDVDVTYQSNVSASSLVAPKSCTSTLLWPTDD
jgi:hypothetical protein